MSETRSTSPGDERHESRDVVTDLNNDINGTHPSKRFDPRIENGVIGALLEYPELRDDALGQTVTADDFLLPINKRIFEIVAKCEVTNDGIIDAVAFIDQVKLLPGICPAPRHLVTEQALKAAAGQIYTKCATDAPERERARSFLKEFIRNSKARAGVDVGLRLINFCHKSLEMGDSFDDGYAKILTKLTTLRIGESIGGGDYAAADIDRVIANVDKRQSEGKASGWLTGIADLDFILGYVERESFIILAARPGQGKTALATQTAEPTLNKNEPVMIFSQEMSRPQIASRLISQNSGVNLSHVTGATVDGVERNSMERARKWAKDKPLWIDDTPGLTVDKLSQKVKLFERKHGRLPTLIIVDYLQLMTGEGESGGNRHVEIQKIARGLQQLKKDFKCSVMVLSQLNREAEKVDEPGPHHLYESGGIEAAADVIMMLWWDKKQTDESGRTAKTWVKLVKNKQGASQVRCELNFDRPTCRFTSISRRDDAPEPVRPTLHEPIDNFDLGLDGGDPFAE